ncbi:hypothetical protein MRQ86_00220 [Streptomyces sp. MMS21 TC-5]|uniref:hypothetical protein n=1 Tax=Streptomyces sp. MMS21 TC-5 TaxID=2925833 RepID=UPI001F617780|nr:hypothetical protein [Streptomyces sp. MMS21 TC-5]MCI4078804.1 hypothetical protein [Streptomyces sp. MMS21 TC-5]
MKYDKRAALGLFLCGVISTVVAVIVAVQDGRGSNTAFLEAAVFFFAVSWIVERFHGRKHP